jgi:anti-anti-sigma factor
MRAVTRARAGANIRRVNVGKHLGVDVRREQDRVVLELHGELDLAGAPLLQEAIDRAEEQEPEMLVIDLEDLAFIDSSGLRVILSAHERAKERGHVFALTRGSEQVQRLLAIAGVSDRLPVIESPDLLVPERDGSDAA